MKHLLYLVKELKKQQQTRQQTTIIFNDNSAAEETVSSKENHHPELTSRLGQRNLNNPNSLDWKPTMGLERRLENASNW